QYIDLGYAQQKADYFKALSESTYQGRDAMGYSGKGTKAYTSQQAQMTGYMDDVMKMPEATRDYGLFVPMANMAARAMQKTPVVAQATNYTVDTDLASVLSPKETSALKSAVGKETGQGMDEGNSVSLAADAVAGQRRTLVGASHQLAGALDRIAKGKLSEEK